MSRVQYLDQDIPRQESSLQGLRGEAKSEAKGILWKPLMAFLKFIAFIWGAGITLEALALAVLTAGNIQRLRENSDEGMPAPAAEGR